MWGLKEKQLPDLNYMKSSDCINVGGAQRSILTAEVVSSAVKSNKRQSLS